MNVTTGEVFGDGAHIIYVNGEYRGNDDLGRLMHDFNCNNAKGMNYDLMVEKTRYLKEHPKGVSEMCKAIEDMVKEYEARGLERGRFNTLFEMVYDGLISMAQAAGRVNMTEEQFRSKTAEAGYSLKQ